MIITRDRLPRRTPLRSRLPYPKRNLLRETTQAFARWLPVTLHWKPASRRAPLPAPRGEAVSRFNAFTTHLHAEFKLFATTLLQRTFTRMHAGAEKIFRSIEKSAPLPLLRRAQSDAAARAPIVSGPGESAISSARTLEFRSSAPHQGPDINPPRATFDLPPLRRAGTKRAPKSGMPRQPVMITAASAAPLPVAPITRAFSPVALAGRPHREFAQSGGPAPRAKMNQVESFSSAPELFWRQVLSPKTNDPGETVSQAQRIAGDEVVPTGTRTKTTGVVPFVPEAALARKPTALSDLEPSFVDRLADDVIRRVERRARIERERRGL